MASPVFSTHHPHSPTHGRTQEGKSQVRSPPAWSCAPGRQTHFRMNYSERAWDLFISVFPPPFWKCIFYPRSRRTPSSPPPHPHIHIILLYTKKMTSFRSREALLYSFCIYIVHYSGSWVEKRALLCIFVLAIVYAGLTEWGNSGYHFNFWCQHEITYLSSCLVKHCIATRRILSLHLLCCVFVAIGLPSNWQL